MWKDSISLVFKVYKKIYGGVTSTLDDIQTESQMDHLFVDIIFVKNTGLRLKTKLNNILAASVLRFYDVFIGIIVNEPSGKYRDLSYHPFHQKIFHPFWTKSSDETFNKWKKKVIDGFNDKNWLGVNIEKTGSGYAKRYVDRRCVVSVIYK